MKNLASLAILLLCAGAFADDLPKIAVYVTGKVGDDEKKVLGTRMTTALVKSGRYQAVERSEEFLNKLDAEHVKQRSGAIDDGQISAVGRQFGVKFVCVADITPAFGEFQVSARIINVETAGIDFSGDASSPLKNMNDLEWVSNQVVKKMFGIQIDEPTQRPNYYAAPTKPPKIKKPRKHDWYWAARSAPTWGSMAGTMPWNSFNVEGGLLWGRGTFFGMDFGFGYNLIDRGSYFGSDVQSGGIMIGSGFSVGSVYDIPFYNLQLVYGGSVGAWYVQERDMNNNNVDGLDNFIHNVNFFAPRIGFRWKFVELSYRGFLGPYSENRAIGFSGNDGFGWNNHQIMFGVYFATSKHVK